MQRGIGNETEIVLDMKCASGAQGTVGIILRWPLLAYALSDADGPLELYLRKECGLQSERARTPRALSVKECAIEDSHAASGVELRFPSLGMEAIQSVATLVEATEPINLPISFALPASVFDRAIGTSVPCAHKKYSFAPLIPKRIRTCA